MIRGALRSLRIYRNPVHLRSLARFCSEELAPGARLVFDIGAHAGDRVAAFRRMGARVVAVEPQATMANLLRVLHFGDPGVTVLRAACGPAPGRAELRVNSRNPTVSTLSPEFLESTRGAAGWEGQVWDRRSPVEVRTLDQLVESHGLPDFVKVDVEGFEAEVLAGLTAPVPRLSFEVTTAAREAGLAALERATLIGFQGFRLSLGESHRWETGWLSGPEMRAALQGLPEAANSGDVLAVR